MAIFTTLSLKLGSAALAMAAVMVTANSALADAPLMKPSSAVEPMATQMKMKADKTLKRWRLVDVDAAAIEETILPRGQEKAADRAERSAKLAGKVTLELFPDVTVTLNAKHVDDAFAGGVVWHGDINGTDYGILVVNNGNITGSIEAGGRSFIIEPTGRGNQHRIREVDPEAFPNDEHMEIGFAPKSTGGTGGGKGKPTDSGSGGTTGGTTGGGTTSIPPPGTILEVKILAAYTARVNTLFAGLAADRIALDVAIVNTGFTNSGIPKRMSLAGVTPVSPTYDEKTYSDMTMPLRDVTSGTVANFGAIREMRSALGADFVTLYADRGEYCGIAWVNGTPPSASYAFSAINPACNGTATLAHELGHNMGLRHDRYVETATGTDVYNYGFVNTTAKFRDIMSYNNACAALGFSCGRITYYSSSKLLYNGNALGVPQGTTGAADASRKLTEQSGFVSAFR